MHHSIVPSHVYKMYVICMLEMQQYQYIDISPYRDALGSDTVRYIFRSYRYIKYRDISMYQHQNYILILIMYSIL